MYLLHFKCVKWNDTTHTTSFLCLQIRLTILSLRECKSVFCSVVRRVYVGKIYSSPAKILKFDWSMHVTWKRRAIVRQIRLSKRFSFKHIHWYSKTKADKYSSCYLFLALLGQVVYFHETDYYCTILSHYLQQLAKVLQNRCLQNFSQFTGKYLCRSLFLNSQQSAAFLIRGSDLDVFLGILWNVKNIIFAEHLETSASVFMEHFWNIT